MPTLKNWSTCTDADPYKPPELRALRVQGAVYDHPNKDRFPDGKNIVSSPVRKVEGRKVTTHSGTVYILEDVDPKFVEYLKEMGKELDPENPIKVL